MRPCGSSLCREATGVATCNGRSDHTEFSRCAPTNDEAEATQRQPDELLVKVMTEVVRKALPTPVSLTAGTAGIDLSASPAFPGSRAGGPADGRDPRRGPAHYRPHTGRTR
jgi:hypothetical protein